MSQENVEVFERAVVAFNARDVDGFVECVAPNVEWLPVMGAVEGGGSFRGHEGVRAYMQGLRDAWEKLDISIDGLRDVGERVLLLGHMTGRGEGSGIQIDQVLAIVADFRDGKMFRLKSYFDQAEALKAVGLEE